MNAYAMIKTTHVYFLLLVSIQRLCACAEGAVVCVQTGDQHLAGTNSYIYITLEGPEKKTAEVTKAQNKLT